MCMRVGTHNSLSRLRPVWMWVQSHPQPWTSCLWRSWRLPVWPCQLAQRTECSVLMVMNENSLPSCFAQHPHESEMFLLKRRALHRDRDICIIFLIKSVLCRVLDYWEWFFLFCGAVTGLFFSTQVTVCMRSLPWGRGELEEYQTWWFGQVSTLKLGYDCMHKWMHMHCWVLWSCKSPTVHWEDWNKLDQQFAKCWNITD